MGLADKANELPDQPPNGHSQQRWEDAYLARHPQIGAEVMALVDAYLAGKYATKFRSDMQLWGFLSQNAPDFPAYSTFRSFLVRKRGKA